MSTASVSPPFSLKIPVNRSTMASRPRVTSPSSSSISASGVNRSPSALASFALYALTNEASRSAMARTSGSLSCDAAA